MISIGVDDYSVMINDASRCENIEIELNERLVPVTELAFESPQEPEVEVNIYELAIF